MEHRALRPLLTSIPLGLMVVGCVTINLYFPEQEVKDLAGKIEEQVQAQAAADGASNPPPPPPAQGVPSGGSRPGVIGLLLGATPAYAQAVPEPEATNPAIRKIIESRAARLANVNQFKASGSIGENNRGDLEIRDLGAMSDLRARAEAQKLVRAENTDREQLYKEIASAKGIDPAQLDRIRETYAETLRANARTGDWIQLPDGSWKQKS